MKQKPTLTLKYSLCAVAAVTFISAAQGATIAHWSFDSDYSLTSGSYAGSLSEVENSGAVASISTAAGESAFGGGAASFDSTESNEAYLTLNQSISFGSADPWALSFWSRRDASSTGPQGMIIGDTSNATDIIWRSDNSVQVEGLRFRNSNDVTYDRGGFTDDNTFEHWVVISDGTGTITTYRNNVAQAEEKNQTSCLCNNLPSALAVFPS